MPPVICQCWVDRMPTSSPAFPCDITSCHVHGTEYTSYQPNSSMVFSPLEVRVTYQNYRRLSWIPALYAPLMGSSHRTVAIPSLIGVHKHQLDGRRLRFCPYSSENVRPTVRAIVNSMQRNPAVRRITVTGLSSNPRTAELIRTRECLTSVHPADWLSL